MNPLIIAYLTGVAVALMFFFMVRQAEKHGKKL